MTSFENDPCRRIARNPVGRWPSWRIAGLAMISMSLFVPGLEARAMDAALGESLAVTPLVLKDGRIARVSIHTVPFPEDAAALASKTAAELETFTQAMATDCFLTAQVIGHVAKQEASGRDTVDIHRLARSRADAIQETLIANGLPQSSIASVWDWQFMVQDARATLWVFQLAAGDDCEEKSLSPVLGQEVASLDKPAPLTEENKAARIPSGTEASVASMEEQSVEPQPAPAAQLAVPAVTKAMPTPVSNQTPVSKTIKEDAPKQVIRAAVAPASEKAAPVALTVMAASVREADKKGRVVVSDNGKLDIVFATNSSYLPQGWSGELAGFLERLEAGKNYVARVQTSVDGDASVAGTSSKEEAAQYNKWLADRRFERVKAWLLKNSEGSTLQIEPTEVTNDGSRRVSIELQPLG